MHLSPADATRLPGIILPTVGGRRTGPRAIETGTEPSPLPPRDGLPDVRPGRGARPETIDLTVRALPSEPTSVDVFEELARFPEPLPLPDPGGPLPDMFATPPPPEGAVELVDRRESAGRRRRRRLRHAATATDHAEPVLVDRPRAVRAGADAPPIDVALRERLRRLGGLGQAVPSPSPTHASGRRGHRTPELGTTPIDAWEPPPWQPPVPAASPSPVAPFVLGGHRRLGAPPAGARRRARPAPTPAAPTSLRPDTSVPTPCDADTLRHHRPRHHGFATDGYENNGAASPVTDAGLRPGFGPVRPVEAEAPPTLVTIGRADAGGRRTGRRSAGPTSRPRGGEHRLLRRLGRPRRRRRAAGLARTERSPSSARSPSRRGGTPTGTDPPPGEPDPADRPRLDEHLTHDAIDLADRRLGPTSAHPDALDAADPGPWTTPTTLPRRSCGAPTAPSIRGRGRARPPTRPTEPRRSSSCRGQRLATRQRGAARRSARPGRPGHATRRRALGPRRRRPRHRTARSRSTSTSAPAPASASCSAPASTTEGRMSGYSFDIDPIYDGGGFLVRQWQADRELWNPIARVAAHDPDSMYGTLTVRLVLHGDHLVASGERRRGADGREPQAGLGRPRSRGRRRQPGRRTGLVVVRPRDRDPAGRRA